LNIWTVDHDSAVPAIFTVGVLTVEFNVVITGFAGGVLSTVTFTDCIDGDEMFHAESVAFAVRLLAHELTVIQVIEKAPDIAEPVPTIVAQLKMFTVDHDSAVQAIVTVLQLVVRLVVVITGAAGAIVSKVKLLNEAGSLEFH
jgi:hypothetical protein